jgi:hypothetical protein
LTAAVSHAGARPAGAWETAGFLDDFFDRVAE